MTTSLPHLDDRCHPDFRSHLGRLLPQTEDDPQSAYGLWPDGRLAYLNPGWFRFAAENEGGAIPADWPMGTSIFDATSPDLRPFYEEVLDSALQKEKPSAFNYECSSPSNVRWFRLTIFPLPSRTGLLAWNALISEGPRTEASEPAIRSRYEDPSSGLLRQCSHCRRTRRGAGPDWVWVEAWVKRVPKNCTHGLCPLCFEHFYRDTLNAFDARHRA